MNINDKSVLLFETLMGVSDLAKPKTINIYPKDFEAKERINELIAEYNSVQSKENKIVYTDTIAILLSSVTTILDAISYVLIAFVSIKFNKFCIAKIINNYL